MSFEVRKINDMTPEFLFGLLHRKHLLTLSARNNPAILANVALTGDFYTISEVSDDGSNAVAWMIETRTLEPGVLELALIPDDKTLCLHKAELLRISEQLRERWFHVEQWDKVQVQVAKSRHNACRALKAMGFVCETRSIGIRNGVTLGKEAEPLMIYGLMPSDPVPAMEEVAHAEA